MKIMSSEKLIQRNYNRAGKKEQIRRHFSRDMHSRQVVGHLILYLEDFIFLAMLCSMWDLNSLTKASLHWEHRILTTVPPEKSLEYFLKGQTQQNPHVLKK